MKIRIEPGFAVFTLLVYALVGELIWPFFLAAGVHELSHLAAVWLLGRKVKIVTLRFADGTEIAAFGSNAYPEGYQAGYAAIRDCFDPIIERHHLSPWEEETCDPRKKAAP